MAYVAITGELINRVEGRIQSMCNTEVASMCPGLKEDYTIDASHIYNLSTWGSENVNLITLIPKDWLSKQTDSYINIVGQNPNANNAAVKMQVRFKGMNTAYARPATDYWNRTSGEIHIDEIRALPDWTLGRAECLSRFEQGLIESDLTIKWENIRSSIVQFLKQCKSLNEAVKLLPTLRMYLTSDDIERMERKVSRGPRTELVAGIDSEGITAAAVAAKLMESF
jgi:hypothetical protein